MKKEKTKPIPKYIVARIKKADAQNNVCLPGRTRFYSYLNIKHHVDFEFAAENIVRTVRIVTF